MLVYLPFHIRLCLVERIQASSDIRKYLQWPVVRERQEIEDGQTSHRLVDFALSTQQVEELRVIRFVSAEQ